MLHSMTRRSGGRTFLGLISKRWLVHIATILSFAMVGLMTGARAAPVTIGCNAKLLPSGLYDLRNADTQTLAPCRRPVAANDTQGWYLGLGVGYDHLQNFTEVVPGGAHLSIPTTDSAMVAGSFGYKWANNLRLEFEVGYDRHQVSAPFSGNTELKSALVNFVYDWQLGNGMTLSVGGGVGPGSFSYCTGAIGGPCTGATGTNLIGQILAEVSHPVLPNVDIFLQVRDSVFLTNSAGAQDVNRQAALIGLRWWPSPSDRTIRTTNIR